MGSGDKSCPMRVTLRLDAVELPESPTGNTTGSGPTATSTYDTEEPSEMSVSECFDDSDDESIVGSPGIGSFTGRNSTESIGRSSTTPAGVGVTKPKKGAHRRANSMSIGGGGSMFSGGITKAKPPVPQPATSGGGSMNPFDDPGMGGQGSAGIPVSRSHSQDDLDDLHDLKMQIDTLKDQLAYATQDAIDSHNMLADQKRTYTGLLKEARAQGKPGGNTKHIEEKGDLSGKIGQLEKENAKLHDEKEALEMKISALQNMMDISMQNIDSPGANFGGMGGGDDDRDEEMSWLKTELYMKKMKLGELMDMISSSKDLSAPMKSALISKIEE